MPDMNPFSKQLAAKKEFAADLDLMLEAWGRIQRTAGALFPGANVDERERIVRGAIVLSSGAELPL